jgi:hypothetical protein
MGVAWIQMSNDKTNGSRSLGYAISVEVLISFLRRAVLYEVELVVSYFTASSFTADRCNGNYPGMF